MEGKPEAALSICGREGEAVEMASLSLFIYLYVSLFSGLRHCYDTR
jgi:hypothetical protein